MTRVYWFSSDRQTSIPMGDYESPELAQAAIEACREKLLAQCADDNLRAIVRAGTWEVIPYEVQEYEYKMPFMLSGSGPGCSHACDYLMVKRTRHYDATQIICPRNCTYPKTDIYWRKTK